MRFLSSIIDFIFPRVCHICGNSLPPDSKYICAPCLSHLPRTLYHRVKDNPMERRFMGQFPFRAAAGHFFYSKDSGIAVMIHDLKYRHFEGLAHYLGTVIAAELLTTSFLSDIDLIIPVPMHFLKKARRGYNQTEKIADGISEVSGIPVCLNLKAVKGHKTQTSLTHEQRLKNIEGVFRVKNPSEIANKKILLVDDVCTTGTTLASAAKIIVSHVPGVEISMLAIGVTF